MVSPEEGKLSKSGYEMLKPNINAQGSRVIIVVVQVGAVKIYVAAAVQALREKETQDETQFTTKNLVEKLVCLGPSYFLLENFHSQLRV